MSFVFFFSFSFFLCCFPFRVSSVVEACSVRLGEEKMTDTPEGKERVSIWRGEQ